MPHKIIWCEPTGMVERYFSRFGREGLLCPKAPNGFTHHRGEKIAGRYQESPLVPATAPDWPPEDDAAWPTHCDYCGEALTPDNSDRSSGSRHIYRRTDTGQEGYISQMPIGACWDAYWYGDHFWKGPDGRCLIVRTPGGEWVIDSRASNCTMPNDNEHRCWVRHGRPEDGTLHVDKNGKTCAAGAGSIQCGKYHGFLHNGALTD